MCEGRVRAVRGGLGWGAGLRRMGLCGQRVYCTGRYPGYKSERRDRRIQAVMVWVQGVEACCAVQLPTKQRGRRAAYSILG